MGISEGAMLMAIGAFMMGYGIRGMLEDISRAKRKREGLD